ncbi:MAG: ABC transporter substrate-binding protein [Propionibacteriaceae bacterium]|jgi:oligopeptide transport system substrate-binding protein|nr:ABC transporter substrate-binding protein [Propionibacteriaceae bacterium]
MGFGTRTIAVAALAAFALVGTACAQNSPDGQSTGDDSAALTEVSVHGCTPQNPLVGAWTNETCGGHILDSIQSQLIRYDSKTMEPKLDIAESIETDDAKLFTVKLKPGYLFSDGTEVKAENFVDAWNYTAYAPNGAPQSTFLSPVVGWDQLQCTGEEGACDEAQPSTLPAKETLDGLKVVDDHTFTIETAEPTSNLLVRLGYTAFAPLPDVFFSSGADAAGDFGKLPVAAGPYKVTENTATQIVLEKNEHYTGAFPGQVDRIVHRIYSDLAAGWADLVAGNLDFLDAIPTDQLVDDAWIGIVGKDRTASGVAGRIEVLTVSPTDPQFQNNPLLRQALGEAIDRETITKVIFGGSRLPADGWVSPAVDGYKSGQCGAACVYDADKAKADYAASGGYQGVLTLTVNGDGGHKDWADAVCNSLRNTLEVDCQVVLTPDFRTLLNSASNGELTGLFRSGWVQDYPSIENYLTPIYSRGAESNYSRYDNPDFEAKLTEAAAADDLDEANKLYQEAEAILANDYPTLPLWYPTTSAAWSDKIDVIDVTPTSWLDTSSLTVKS